MYRNCTPIHYTLDLLLLPFAFTHAEYISFSVDFCHWFFDLLVNVKKCYKIVFGLMECFWNLNGSFILISEGRFLSVPPLA